MQLLDREVKHLQRIPFYKGIQYYSKVEILAGLIYLQQQPDGSQKFNDPYCSTVEDAAIIATCICSQHASCAARGPTADRARGVEQARSSQLVILGSLKLQRNATSAAGAVTGKGQHLQVALHNNISS